MQPLKHIQVDGWAALPNIPCYGPGYFAALNNHFVLLIVQTFNNVQMNGWTCSPKPISAHFTVLKNYFVWIVWRFQKHSNPWLGRAPPNTAQLFSRCWKLFFWMVWRFSNSFELMAGLWSPKHSPVLFTVLKNRFVWMFCSRLETFKFMAGPRSPNFLSRPSSFQGVEESFRFDVVQIFKNVQMNGWSCSPKHGPFLFTVLKNLLVWMLCSHLKTFKFMVGQRSPTSLSRPSSFRGVKD